MSEAQVSAVAAWLSPVGIGVRPDRVVTVFGMVAFFLKKTPNGRKLPSGYGVLLYEDDGQVKFFVMAM